MHFKVCFLLIYLRDNSSKLKINGLYFFYYTNLQNLPISQYSIFLMYILLL